MTGLIWKDLLCLRKMIILYALFTAGFLALCAAVDFPVSSMASFLSVTVMVLPMTAFTYDHAAKWEAYGLALPVSRTKTVAARYLFYLLLMGGVAVIAAVFGVVLILAGRRDSALELLVTVCTCMGVGVLFNAVLLPLVYRFGIERAKVIAAGLIIAAAGLAALWLVPLDGLNWLESLNVLWLDGLPWLVISIATLVCAALLSLSYLISCAIYKKKEM